MIRSGKTKVRPYRGSDRRGFLDLVKSLAAFEKLPGPSPASCRRLIADVGRRVKVLIAEAEGRPAGYAVYLFTYSSFLARPTLYVEDIFILPGLRRRGIGKEMWRRLVREARKRKCGRMEWMVLDWNLPARRFYRKIGGKRLKEWLPYRKVL